MVKSREIVPTARNALTTQETLFVHHVSQGVRADVAAMLAGFDNPKAKARALMRSPAVQAELAAEAKITDVELESASRFHLRALLDNQFTPAAVKARISLELLKRKDRNETNSPQNRSLDQLSESELMRLITDAQHRLGHASADLIVPKKS